MRILFLTQVLPYPLDAGPKTRAYYVLRYLARQHEVTLVSFVRAADPPEAVEHLRQHCTAVHTVPIARSRVKDIGYLAQSLLTGQPFIIARDHSAAMQARLSALLQDEPPFDVIHGDQLWMAPYVLYARGHAAPARPLTVLDQHNAVYMILRRLAQSERNPLKRWLAGQEAEKLAAFEADICTRCDRVVWVTHEDYAAVAAVSPHRDALINSGIIPIAVDPVANPVIVRAPQVRRVTFLGGLHYPPNAQGVCWFAEHIFPQVLAQAPDAVLTVIGRQPPSALADLGIPPANLDVPGYVDDPRPYLGETAAFIVPLLAGGGMRVKILDAWSWGLAIVSTTVGAEGICTRPGANLLLADDPADFANAVVALLQDHELNRRISEAGRASVAENYDWRTVYRAWDQVYQP